MQKYELVYILAPDLEEEQVQENDDWVKSVIDRYGGQVEEVDSWGKRRLGYEINDYQEGIYSIMNFTGDKKVIGELERVFKISDQVIRYLIVKEEE